MATADNLGAQLPGEETGGQAGRESPNVSTTLMGIHHEPERMESMKQIRVGGFSSDTDTDSLKVVFEKHGQIEKAEIKRDDNLAVITFEDEQVAKRVSTIQHSLKGQVLTVSLEDRMDSTSYQPAPTRGRIHVKHLPPGLNCETLQAYFEDECAGPNPVKISDWDEQERSVLVDFRDKRDAEDAAKKGITFDKKELEVELCDTTTESEDSSDDDDNDDDDDDDDVDSPWVLVTELQPGFDSEMLGLYAESPRYSGGDVTRLKTLEDGTTALICYEDQKVAESFCKKQHVFEQYPVKVSRISQQKAQHLMNRLSSIPETSLVESYVRAEARGGISEPKADQEEMSERPLSQRNVSHGDDDEDYDGIGELKSTGEQFENCDEDQVKSREHYDEHANQTVTNDAHYDGSGARYDDHKDRLDLVSERYDDSPAATQYERDDNYDDIYDDTGDYADDDGDDDTSAYASHNVSCAEQRDSTEKTQNVAECDSSTSDNKRFGDDDKSLDGTQQDRHFSDYTVPEDAYDQHVGETDCHDVQESEDQTDDRAVVLEVSDIPEKWMNQEMLTLLLQNPKVGGQVMNIELYDGENRARVTFHDNDVAVKLADQGYFTYKGRTFNVHLYIEEERPESCDVTGVTAVEVCGIPVKYQDEEILKMFLEKEADKVEDIELICEEDKAVVTFVDSSAAEKLLQSGNVRLGKEVVTVRAVPAEAAAAAAAADDDDDVDDDDDDDDGDDDDDDDGTLAHVSYSVTCAKQQSDTLEKTQDIADPDLLTSDDKLYEDDDRTLDGTQHGHHLSGYTVSEDTYGQHVSETGSHDEQESENLTDDRAVVLEVSDIPKNWLNEDMLTLLLSKVGGQVMNIELYDGENRAHVTFHDNDVAVQLADQGYFTYKGKTFNVHLYIEEERSSTLTEAPVLNTLEVTGIPQNFLSEEMLALYFENSKKGGGETEKIQLDPQQETALITFCDPAVCHALADQQTILLGKKEVKVQLYEPQNIMNHKEMTSLLEVEGLSGNLLDEDMLRLAFENPDKGGGDVASITIIPEESKARIAFCDHTVGVRLADKGKMMIGKRELRLSLGLFDAKEEPPCTIAVTGLTESFLDEDMLKLYFTNTSKGGGEVFSIQVIDEEQKALITFKDPEVALGFAERKSIKMGKSTANIVMHVEEETVTGAHTEDDSCTIQVSGLTAQWLDDEMLKLYFESPKHGGGHITNIDVVEEDTSALITFADIKVARSFADKKTVQLGKTPVDIAMHTVKTAGKSSQPEPPPDSIEVSGLPDHFLDQDMIKLYFENAQKGGGEIQDIEIIADKGKAVIKFSDPAVAKSFAEKETVNLGKKKVIMKILAPEPPVNPCTVELYDLIPASLNKDIIELHFENEASGGGKVNEVLLFPDQSIAHVTFADERVAKHFLITKKLTTKKFVYSIRKPSSKKTASSADTMQEKTTNIRRTVQLSPIPRKCTRDIIELTLENVLDDSDCFEDIVIGRNSATVTFTHPEMAQKLIEISKVKMPKGVLSVVEWAETEYEPGEKSEAGYDTEDDRADGDKGSGNLDEFPVTSRSVLLWGVNEDDEERLSEMLEEYFCCSDYELFVANDGSETEVLMRFQDVAEAVAAYDVATDWDNDDEDISVQGAVFLYDPPVTETRAVCVKDLRKDVDLENMVILVEGEREATVKDKWFDRHSGQAVLTMEDSESVHNILRKSTMRSQYSSKGVIHFEQLSVPRQPKTPHCPVEMKKLCIHGVPSEVLDGALEELLETYAKCEVDSIIYSPTKLSTVMVGFDGKPDYASIRLMTSMEPVCGVFLCAEHISLPTNIQVSPVEEKDQQFLEYAVESDEWGNVSVVEDTMVYYEEHRTVIVQLESHHDVVKVCTGDKTFRGKDVEVSEYYPEIGILPADMNYHSPDIWIPCPIQTELSEKMLKYVRFKSQGKKFVLPEAHTVIDCEAEVVQLQCTLKPGDAAFYELCDTWDEQAVIACEALDQQISYKELQVKYGSIWHNFINAVTGDMRKLEHVAVVEKDDSNHLLHVYGLVDEVAGPIESILSIKTDLETKERNRLDTVDETAEIDAKVVKLMAKGGVIENIQQKYNDLEIQVRQDQIQLHGHKKSVRKANDDILDFAVQITPQSIKIEPAKVKLMKLPTVEKFLESKMHSCPLYYELNESENRVDLYCHDQDRQEAIDVIENSLWADCIDLDKKAQLAIKQEAVLWKNILRDLQEEYEGKLVIDVQDGKVEVAGTDENTRRASEAVSEFLQTLISVSEYFELKVPVARYLKIFGRPSLSRMQQQYQNYNLKVELSLNLTSPGIILGGMKDGVKDCTDDIHALIGDIKHKSHDIRKPGLAKYFCTEAGLTELRTIETNARAVIHIPGVTDKDLRDAETSEQRRLRAMHKPILAGEVSTVRGKLTVYYGDVCAMKNVDAVVCGSTDGKLRYPGGLGRALLDKGGPFVKKEIADFLRKYGDVTGICITGGGKLPFSHIVHAVIPSYTPGDEGAIHGVVTQLLEEIHNENIRSLAFTAMGVAKAGYSVQDSTTQIVSGVVDFLKKRDSFDEIRFVGFLEGHVQAFKSACRQKFKADFTDHEHKPGDDKTHESLGKWTRFAEKEIIGYDTKEGIHFSVIHGDITEQTCDAVMNTTNTSVDLTQGYVSSQLLSRAGKQMQREAHSKTKHLRPGQVITTKGYNLACRFVFHGVSDKWGYGADRTLKELITNTLNAAHAEKLSSLAFPSIGTKGLKVPHNELARVMMEAIQEFSQKRDQTSLKQICIVAHVRDDTTVTAFQKLILELPSHTGANQSSSLLSTQNLESVTKAGPSSSSPSCTTSHGLQFKVITGDITDQKVDAIFNSTSVKLDLSLGYVSKVLSKKAGPAMQLELDQKKPSKFGHGDIIDTKGHKLSCDHVFHGACLPWSSTKSERTLHDLIRNSLTLADKSNFSTFAFPSMGTGTALKTPHSEFARIMCEEINAIKASSLKEVFVVAHHKDKETLKAFEEMMKDTASSAHANLSRTMSNVDVKAALKSLNPTLAQGSSLPSDTGQPFSGNFDHVTVLIKTGDILKEKVDAIVNSTNTKKTGSGRLCTAILDAGGADLKKEYHEMKYHKGVAITNAGSLICHHVVHLCISSDTTKSGLKDLIKECLGKCEQMNMSAISFPAIGTGALKLGIEEMATEMLEAVVHFAKKSQAKKLIQINIVVGQHAFTSFVKAFNEVSGAKPKTGLMRQAANAISSVKDRFTPIGSMQSKPSMHVSSPSKPHQQSRPSPRRKCYQRKLSMSVYAMEEQAINRAIQLIEGQEQEHINTYDITDDAIPDLSDERKKAIKDFETYYSLDITIDVGQKKISLVGLSADTTDATKKILEVIEEHKKAEKMKKAANALYESVNWIYDENKKYPPEINYIIEEASKARNESVEFEMKGVMKKIRFEDSVEESAGQTAVPVRRECKGDKALPSDWEPMQNDNSKLVIIPTDKITHRQVSKTINKTSPSTQVTQIERVQIQTLYKKYAERKDEMQNKLPDIRVETCNLWIGITSDKLKGVNTKGFDRFNLGQGRSDLGQGVYFTDNASEALKNCGSGSPKYLYRCKVLTGDFVQGASGIREPPPKNPNDKTILYDSCVDNVQKPTVFVAFKDWQAYPEYLVTCQ